MHGRRSVWAGKRRLLFVASVVFWVSSVGPSAAEASNEALLRLLQVLKDRGSITAEEYDDIRRVAEGSEPLAPALAAPVSGAFRVVPALALVPAPAQAPTAAAPSSPATTEARVAAIEKRVDDQAKSLSGKWYEKVGLRGYTQFRFSEVLSRQGLALDVPNDRSVNENESFMIRRGRFVFSGDPTEHLGLYAQFDFNGSTGAADYSLQMRDLYADISLNQTKTWRVRLGQSKVPYGWVNLQSSQNRAALERPDALNSAVEGERDLGASLMWASTEARRRFRDLTALGLKGSGDYGVAALGAYMGQGLNRADQDGDVHLTGRLSYPFKLASGQFVELGLQGYSGRFVSPVQAITVNGTAVTPAQRGDGILDQRFAATAIWYPQPFGVEAEWTVGRGPTLSRDNRTIDVDSLHGGYVQVNYRQRSALGTWFPFSRWNYYDGARKFARNAPRTKVNELDLGMEFAKWAEVELTAMYTRTFSRTRTGTFPYGRTTGGHRVGLQVQWNY